MRENINFESFVFNSPSSRTRWFTGWKERRITWLLKTSSLDDLSLSYYHPNGLLFLIWLCRAEFSSFIHRHSFSHALICLAFIIHSLLIWKNAWDRVLSGSWFKRTGNGMMMMIICSLVSGFFSPVSLTSKFTTVHFLCLRENGERIADTGSLLFPRKFMHKKMQEKISLRGDDDVRDEWMDSEKRERMEMEAWNRYTGSGSLFTMNMRSE